MTGTLFVLLGMRAVPLSAAVVNIDFQGENGMVLEGGGEAVLTAPGGYWNLQGSSGEAVLRMSTGEATAVRAWTSGLTGTIGLGDDLFGDYLVGRVELRGLAAGSSYRLVLYSAANILSQFALDGPWALTPESERPPGPSSYGATSLPGVEGYDYFEGVAVADGDGVVAIETERGALAGLQIDLAHNPEPSGFLLQAVAGALGLVRRRR